MDSNPRGSSVHGIFKSKTTGRGCPPLLRGLPDRGQTLVSCVSRLGRQVLYLLSQQFVKHQDQDVFCYDDTNLCERCRCVCVFAYQHKTETRVVWKVIGKDPGPTFCFWMCDVFLPSLYSSDIYCALPVCQAVFTFSFVCLEGAFLFCCCFLFFSKWFLWSKEIWETMR